MWLMLVEPRRAATPYLGTDRKWGAIVTIFKEITD